MKPRAYKSIGPLRRTAACVVAAAAVVGGASLTSPAVGAQGGDEIDVLTATREEVRVAVEALNTQLADQQAVLASAHTAVEAAGEAAARAEARVELARHEVVQAEEAVRRYALEAYIRPPAEDAVRVLSMSNADDAGYAKSVLKIMAAERYEVVEILLEKRSIAEQEQAAADEAAGVAAAASAEAESRLAELEQTLVQQQELAASLDDRLDAALAEAAALEDVDRQMAEELAAQEIALRETAAPTAGPGASSRAAAASSPATTPADPVPPAAPGAPPAAPPAGSPTPTSPPRPTPTSPPAPPTTAAPVRPPSGVVTRADVTSVGGILVHTSIATNTRNLLNAANAAGISLGGSGWRDTARQIELRRAHCGPSYYDIYQKPSSQCSPPTAIPGRSMHERGLALDLTHNGALIRSRSTPAFRWLAANAARFGFYNLPSEPWHWSTNGN